MTDTPEKPQKRTSLTTLLKRNVKHFHTITGMKYPTIGRKAIQNPRFMERLLAGGTITLESADKIYDFMAERGFHFNRTNEVIYDEGRQRHEEKGDGRQENSEGCGKESSGK